MFDVVGLPAFADNYLWLMHRDSRAAVVDPGDAAVVNAALDAQGLTLDAILLTHHHQDHTGGVAELVARWGCRVVGPRHESIAHVNVTAAEGDLVRALGVGFEVLDVPGHTKGHIAFYEPISGQAFVGDTLFAAGCGRLFEGTPAQMWRSLRKLAALPSSTRVYCAHEYTLANLRFARAVDPDNAALQDREAAAIVRRRDGLPTVPFTIDDELQTNPFIRADTPALVARAREVEHEARIADQLRQWSPLDGPVRTFATLRAWKNVF